MKTRIFFTALFLLELTGFGSLDASPTTSENDTIKVCVTPGVKSLAESWISAYKKMNPDLNLEMKELSMANLRTEVTGENTLGLIKQHPNVHLVAESMWHLTLGREVIVAVVNPSNPNLEILKKTGISETNLARIITSKNPRWNEILTNGTNEPIHLYLEDDPELKLAVSRFLVLDPETIGGVKSTSDFTSILQTDVNAIGFCNLLTATNLDQLEFSEKITLLPLDCNGNGHMDYNENIYGKLEQFERAIWIGKYPRPLISNIYAVASDQPKNKDVTNFLTWIITTGQIAIVESGFTDLAYSEKQSQLDKLIPATLANEELSKNDTTSTIILITFLVLLITAGLALNWNSRRKSAKLIYDDYEPSKILRPESIEIPNGLFYDKSHTWAFMEKDGRVKVGIDDFMQHVTGNYTGLILKNPNEILRRSEIAATLIHEGKKLSIYAPVSGRIIQSNADLVDFPTLVNSSPYSWGWLYEIEPANWIREIGFLKMSDQYREWIRKEFIRFKDFITGFCQKKELEGLLVLQEGGELPDHVLHGFEPHVWEEFQLRFIDNSEIS